MSDESVVHAIASVDTLETYFETLKHLVDECKLHMSDEGFHVSAVDPANVAMMDYCDLAPRAFEAYDAPGAVTVGVNIGRLLDVLDPAGSDTLVDWNMNMETRKLEIQYGSTSHSLALIDPDQIRSEPNQPDLDLPNEVVIEGSDFKHALTVTDLVSDHVFIRGNIDKRQVEFFAQGDTDDTTVEYGDEDVIDAFIDADDEAIFSHEYLECFAKPIPNDAEVTLRFADENPVRLSWGAIEGAMDVRQMCAPRIQSH